MTIALALGAAATLPPRLLAQAPPRVAADRPVERTDANSQTAHAQLVDKARRGRIDVYFVGDSITRRWGALDYPVFLQNWTDNFRGWNAANFGWGGDTTQNILWRLQNGEFEGVTPKVIVLQAGTNNVAAAGSADPDAVVADITRGITAIVDLLSTRAPGATIIVTAIFPRSDRPLLMPVIDAINRNLAALAGRPSVRVLNINDRLADRDGRIAADIMADGLHPAVKGYQVWADALKPLLAELLGPRASTDVAPPPTGDPSFASPRR